MVIGAPLLFFGAVELALRVGGFGRDPNFFIPDEKPGHYRTNPRFTELFFPASFGLKPVNFRLPREKPEDSLRVFVLGESAAMGVPEPAFGLAPQLQAQLRACRPGAKIDVYNLGVTAINSHAIRLILSEALEFEPDLLVLYMGNNEVVGPYGAGAVVRAGAMPLPLIRASLWVRSTRIGQLLQEVMAHIGRAGQGFRDWRGMEMFADKSVPVDDLRLAEVYANFSANLEAMLATARSASVKTVLSTVAVNVRDCAPFVSQSNPALTTAQQAAWLEAWTGGRQAEMVGDYVRARELLTRAVELDRGHAGGHYLLAASHDALGDKTAARNHAFEALQRDALRFRADATINRIIRDAARKTSGKTTLVDAARDLGADPASAGALAGNEYFFEHVHFTWEGNFAVARLLAEASADSLFSPASSPRPWLDAAACAAAIGYTELAHTAMLRSMDELTSRPPFTGQLRYGVDRTRLARQIAASSARLAESGAGTAQMAIISSALAADPENPHLLFQAAAGALRTGDIAGARVWLERLAEVQPFSPEQAALRAVALQASHNVAGAEEVLLRAVKLEPYYYQTYGLLTQLWVGTGRAAHARDYMAELVGKMSDSRLLRSTYAQLLAHAGAWPAAEAQWREVLRLVPDDESALAPLLKRLNNAGQTEEMVARMRAAHAYNPRSFANNQRLVEYFDNQGDTDQAVSFMQDLAESGPVNALLFRDLAVNLKKLGRLQEMRHALLRGRRVAENEGDAALLAEFDRLDPKS